LARSILFCLGGLLPRGLHTSFLERIPASGDVVLSGWAGEERGGEEERESERERKGPRLTHRVAMGPAIYPNSLSLEYSQAQS